MEAGKTIKFIDVNNIKGEVAVNRSLIVRYLIKRFIERKYKPFFLVC